MNTGQLHAGPAVAQPTGHPGGLHTGQPGPTPPRAPGAGGVSKGTADGLGVLALGLTIFLVRPIDAFVLDLQVFPKHRGSSIGNSTADGLGVLALGLASFLIFTQPSVLTEILRRQTASGLRPKPWRHQRWQLC